MLSLVLEQRAGGATSDSASGARWVVAAQGQPGLSAAVTSDSTWPAATPRRQCVVLARARLEGVDLSKPEAQQVGLLGPLPAARHHVVESRGGQQPCLERRGIRPAAARTSAPPNASRHSRCRRGSNSCCWSDWPWTATSARRARRAAAAGTLTPPAKARERPSAVTVRARITRRRRSPPASSARCGDPASRPARDAPSTRAGSRPAGCARVGPGAEQEAQGGDHHRLAGTRLAGDDGETRSELERRRVDHAERRRSTATQASVRSSRRRAGAPLARRASPRPAGRTWRPAGR